MRPTMRKVTVKTNAGGLGTARIRNESGLIRAIAYEKVDFDNGVNFNITTSETGQQVWVESNVNDSKTVRPSAPVNDQFGQPTGAYDHIDLADEELVIVVTTGGANKTGVFKLIFA